MSKPDRSDPLAHRSAGNGKAHPSATSRESDEVEFLGTRLLDDEPSHSASRPAMNASAKDPEPRCTNCWSGAHLIDRCLLAPTGLMRGCPLCKTAIHQMEDCSLFPEKSPKEIIQSLVWDRGHLPAWNTKVHWFEYLYIYMGTLDFFRLPCDAVLRASLPWTPQFTRALASGPQAEMLQTHLDEDGDTSCLPEDPATRNLDTAFKTFAQPMKHVWPYSPM
ncbi:hypothetical protein ACJZ2D_016242 [Fusarium nematophilum]